MRRVLWAALVAGLIAHAGARLAAHVRLKHPTNGVLLRWSSPGNVGIVIHSTGSDDIADASHETALRLAIQDWNAVTGTSATLVEDASPAAQARTDWASSGVHLMLFDESNASGFFPSGSATVAITPVWFFSSGVIQDADVLFNGAGYHFTTSGEVGRFDVEDVAAHELGHLLGLDHSGATGATLFPYVDTHVLLQRSLSADDVTGLRDAYPAGVAGRITGTVARASDGSGVAGAYVVAVDAQGRTAGSVLADVHGAFSLRGLAPSSYAVYARPLDNPVSGGNLGSGYSGDVATDFEPAIYASTATITAGESVAMGVLAVGADVALNLGTFADPFPVRVIQGQSRTVTLHGTGLAAGSTLSASDPDILLGPPTWFVSQVTFQVTVPAGEERGHVDLQVVNAAGKRTILPAALEITPPSPVLSLVAPASGSVQGGSALTLTGSEFHAGARVVIGERIYTDGLDATVIEPDTILLTTGATTAGAHDVVVIDPSGVEGRLVDGFTARTAPVIEAVFPGAGQALGGTEVVLAGSAFADGLVVRIDGVAQGAVSVEDGTRARFTTAAGVVGGPYALELENPDGATASSSFAFAAQADPTLDALAPEAGTSAGGDVVTLTGSGFTPAARVFFGADADTGVGAVEAASVTFVDAGTLTVETPEHARGPASVLVVDDATGQGALLPAAFTFGGGGGGGSCTMVPVAPPSPPRAVLEALAGGGWMLALLAVLVLRARRARPERG